MMPGDFVVCINGNFSAKARMWVPTLPTEGTLYTVREVRPSLGKTPKPGITLEEIVNPLIPIEVRGMGIVELEPIFAAERFRPVRRPNIEPLRTFLLDFASV